MGALRSRLQLRRVLFCIALGCIGAAHAQLPSEFETRLQRAEAAQEERLPPISGLQCSIIPQSPTAELANGDGDVSTTGECGGDIETFCKSVKAGRRRLADCLQKQVNEEVTGNVQGVKVKGECKIELAAFQADLGQNVNRDIPLALACQSDAASFCSDLEDETDPAVASCLGTHREELTEGCKAEVLIKQELGAWDYRIDPYLYKACQIDADRLCKGVQPEAGAVQSCLVVQQGRLTMECSSELFRQEVESADDIRLNAPLVSKCMGAKKDFCNDIEPGAARVKDCLEEHRNDDDFPSDCRDELEAMMQERSTDFRLDSILREACKEDIMLTCGWDDEPEYDTEGSVISCLQDFRNVLMDSNCQEQVHKMMSLASEDIRFNQILSDACLSDRERFCKDTQQLSRSPCPAWVSYCTYIVGSSMLRDDTLAGMCLSKHQTGMHTIPVHGSVDIMQLPVLGSARVMRCLQDSRSSLSRQCQASLFDQEVKMAEDIDFKYPLKQACLTEIQLFCPNVQHGHANIVRCLQNHTSEIDMSNECKDKIQEDEARSSQDYRLNFKLREACDADAEALCGNLCQAHQACGGQVLSCLTDKRDDIKSKQCRDEVFYFEKMEVTDFRNDVLLAEACHGDVNEYCSSKKPGAVLECLRQHRPQLSSECRKEELKLNILQSQDVRLQPTLHKQCSEEIAVFCGSVQPGQARIFGCLQENVAKSGFGESCRQQVEQRQEKMQDDYRLNYGVASQCGADVDAYCSFEKGMAHGETEVLSCLINNYDTVDEGCQREVSRAVRMALWNYQPQLALTEDCDEDIQEYCLDSVQRSKSGVWGIGAAGRCLSKQLAEGQYMNQNCKKLVLAAAPKDVQGLFSADSSTTALSEKILALQSAAGIKLVNPRASGVKTVTLSGWAALFGVVSLIAVIVGGAFLGYQRWLGRESNYVMVSKSGDV